MRTAPPVSVRCTGGQAWRCLQAGLTAAACGALSMAALGHAGLAVWPAAPLMVAAAWVVWWLAPPQSIALAWDGQGWSAEGQAGSLTVMIDLGSWLLLRLQPATAGRPMWIPVLAVEPARAGHALRAALYCRVPSAKPQVAARGPAQPD